MSTAEEAAPPPPVSAHETVEAVVRAQIAKAFGGKRGTVEAAVPTIAFTLTWIFTEDLKFSVILSVALSVVLLLARIVQRSTPQFVLNSLFGIGIGAFFALRSGNAEDAFLPGMLWIAVVEALMILSILVRWPFLGFLLGATNPDDPIAWHRDKSIVDLCVKLSWIMALPGLIKLSVQIPLYLAGSDYVFWLGIAKVALGWPVYLAALATVGWMLARGRTAQPTT
ncbi:DUF3159 domain-containing protein [Herbidospora galbida]|uniref:DUF3159 domain-containing protein n=1 Tax=Herbidospora galbida TaxID=2575442 RepID=A0A4U3MFF7_9ACTN|nr:DUF3159 domain-containing protein [Herbidospora galbida]TKK87024.1 DUF3159 domain-containing protein [Herbidospora galbida]